MQLSLSFFLNPKKLEDPIDPHLCGRPAVAAEFPNVPIVALTATATVAVLQDVQRQLGMREPVVFQRSFDRPNLRSFSVHYFLEDETIKVPLLLPLILFIIMQFCA